MSWVSLNAAASSEMVSSLDAIKDTLKGAVDAITTVLDALKTVAKTILKFIVALDDAAAAAIRAVCNTILALIDDIEKNARQIYAMGVMPVDPNDVVRDFGQISGLNGRNMELSDGTATLLEGAGGNAGFIRSVAESFYDRYDDNRPRFDENAYVGGVVFLTGAESYIDAIPRIKKLQNLFSSRPYPYLTLDDQKQPLPSSIRAKPVAPRSTNIYEVKLSWDPAQKLQVLAIYGNPRYTIREIVIYRGKPNEMLPRGDLSEYVVDRFEYTGFETQWFDRSFTKEYAEPVWFNYGVGFGLNIVDANGNETEIAEPQGIRRTVVCVGPGGVQPSRNLGVPPDWMSIGLFDLIPPLGKSLRILRQNVEDLKDASEAASEQIKKLIASIEKEIDRYAALVDDIAKTIKELIDLLSFPEGYFGLVTIGPVKGGNEAFVQELKNAMTDISDAGRPPFDKGTEIVAGAVLMYGVESPSSVKAVSAFVETISSLFGGVIDEGSAAYRTIRDASLAAAQEVCINDALIKTLCVAAADTGAPDAYGEDLEEGLSDPLCS